MLLIGNWQSWNKLVPAYNYPDQSTPDFNTILVPIIESVCIDYLINCIARENKPVLLIGEQGSAKTIMMKTFMKKLNSDKYLIRSFNFSSATSPYQFQVDHIFLKITLIILDAVLCYLFIFSYL